MSSANVVLSTDLSSSFPVHSTPVKRRPTASDKKSAERFYCPFEGCNRSFAELWRLKVHYRASPDVRGSGKERGHGAELESCPKCGAELKPGRHHVGCTGGKHSATKNERKRISRSKKHAEQPPSNASDSKDLKQEVNSSTAIGLPISWLPLDFDQFFLPIATEFSPVFLRPRRQCLQGMNLVYGNLGERPSMVTTQIGIESDVESLSFIKEEAPSSLTSFTTGLGSLNEAAGGRGGGVIDNDSNLSFGPNTHHYEALEASLFDDGFDTLLSPPKADGIKQRRLSLSDAGKRDKSQNLEMKINRPESKYIATSLLSDPTLSRTSPSNLAPPFDAFFESPSFLTSNDEGSIFSWKCSGSGFRHVGGESPSSFFLKHEGFNPNPKTESSTSDDFNHFNTFMDDFYGMEFQNPLSADESHGLKSKEEKISK